MRKDVLKQKVVFCVLCEDALFPCYAQLPDTLIPRLVATTAHPTRQPTTT